MKNEAFIYVDSSPEPEDQPPAPVTFRNKGKGKARPPPTDDEIIMVSDDEDLVASLPVALDWGIPGPSGTASVRKQSGFLETGVPNKEPPVDTAGKPAGAAGQEITENVVSREQSPIPQWVLDDMAIVPPAAEPSGDLNQNKGGSRPPPTLHQAYLHMEEFQDDVLNGQDYDENGILQGFDVEAHHNALTDQNLVQHNLDLQAPIRIPPRPEAQAGAPGAAQPASPRPVEPEEDARNQEDMVSAHLASVLAVIPDVQPDHALGLITQRILAGVPAETVVELIINHLFDSPYPKVERKRKRDDASGSGTGVDKGKGKAVAVDEKKWRIDWMNVDRPIPSGSYSVLALDQLCQDFRYITKAHVKAVLASKRFLYFPSFFELNLLDNTSPHWKKSATPRSKGKRPLASPEFDLERKAVLDALDAQQEPGFVIEDEASSSKPSHVEEEEEVEGGIECGCCFASYAFENMIQCPDAHLFCKTCARRTAEEAIGVRKAVIRCMDQDGCQQEFSTQEIKRFLDPKAFELLEKIRAERAVTDACLEGLEECPFCDFKCIIENEQERLFRCENDECGIVSCRQCKKEDHLPKSCAEVVDDKNLDARHAVEEAMTEALMRKCPKCSKAFIKENGCNKMRCPYCQTMSCYVCRQVINGYDHFNQQPGHPVSTGKRSKKCPLWDDLDKRHNDEVAEAARRAALEQELANPDINPDQLKVDLPSAPKRQDNGVPQIPRPLGGDLFAPLLPDLHALHRMQAQADQAERNARNLRALADNQLRLQNALANNLRAHDGPLERALEGLGQQPNEGLARGQNLGDFILRPDNPHFGNHGRNIVVPPGPPAEPMAPLHPAQAPPAQYFNGLDHRIAFGGWFPPVPQAEDENPALQHARR